MCVPLQPRWLPLAGVDESSRGHFWGFLKVFVVITFLTLYSSPSRYQKRATVALQHLSSALLESAENKSEEAAVWSVAPTVMRKAGPWGTLTPAGNLCSLGGSVRPESRGRPGRKTTLPHAAGSRCGGGWLTRRIASCWLQHFGCYQKIDIHKEKKFSTHDPDVQNRRVAAARRSEARHQRSVVGVTSRLPFAAA